MCVFRSYNNPNLYCIEVDDSIYSSMLWIPPIDTLVQINAQSFAVDSIVNYSTFCSNECSNAIPTASSKIISSYVYPNPASSFITIVTEDNLSKINTSLYDLSGNLIFKGDNREININCFPSGIYMLKLEHNNQQELIKLVIQ